MTGHWIADVTGVHALVSDAEQVALWTRVRGWRIADAPAPTDQVQVVNGDLFGRIPFAALADGWADLGWKPGAPPEPIDLTKDPTFVDQPPVAGPAMPQTKTAAGGQSKEK